MRDRRDSNLELLRLLAMLMIVANHFATKSGLLQALPVKSLDGRLFFSQFLASLGKLGVDVFVLISAWFMVGKSFRSERLFRTWIPTFIVGVGVLVVLSLCGYAIKSDDWIRNLFPLTRNAYWFVTAYLPFIALVPFVLDLCQRLPRLSHGYAAGGLLFVYSVMPTILSPFGVRTASLYGFSELLWFLVLAVLGSFLRRTVDLKKLPWWKPVGALVSAMVVIAVYTYICDLKNALGFKADWALWRHENSIFIVIVACSLLLLFAKFRMGSVCLVNVLSAGVFGVYLIHDHPVLTRILWRDWVGVISLLESEWYVVKSFMAIGVVFILCLTLSCLINLIISRAWQVTKMIWNRKMSRPQAME